MEVGLKYDHSVLIEGKQEGQRRKKVVLCQNQREKGDVVWGYKLRNEGKPLETGKKKKKKKRKEDRFLTEPLWNQPCQTFVLVVDYFGLLPPDLFW